MLDVFDVFRGMEGISIPHIFCPDCKIVEFSPRENVGLQDSRLVVHILQLEWSHGLGLNYFEVNVCALECIEDVLELAGEVFAVVGRLECFHTILSHHRRCVDSSTALTAED